MDALSWLNDHAAPPPPPPPPTPAAAEPVRSPQEVPWLKSVLQVYPGSRHGNVETRGLDSDFALDTYVETALEQKLFDELSSRRVRLIILCGNAGDGKTALLQHLAGRFGVERLQSSQRLWEASTRDGLTLRANLDGAAAYQGRSANELLDEFFTPFLIGPPTEDVAHLLAINDGRLLEWIDEKERNAGPVPLTGELKRLLDPDLAAGQVSAHLKLISLNRRSLVGGLNRDAHQIKTEFLDKLIDRMLGGAKKRDIWKPCQTCSAFDRCVAGRNAALLLAGNNTGEAKLAGRVKDRLAEAFQAVHQRGEVHITARELRAAISYILFGVYYCTDLHDDPGLTPPAFWDMAFDPSSPGRQDKVEVLRELTFLDPGLEAHPKLDRWLEGKSARLLSGGGPCYPGLATASARRRAYFEWQRAEIEAVAGGSDALGLAHGAHLEFFREAGFHDAAGNAALCARLCRGISQLESLPPVALGRCERVPLKVTPRTPTETTFWVEKSLVRFRLEADVPTQGPEIPALHRRLRLIYAPQRGGEDVLSMGYELFHTLLELADGHQLSELRSDDLFANLAIFTQRLAQEDEERLLAWNPKAGETVHEIGIRRGGEKQVLVCGKLGGDGSR